MQYGTYAAYKRITPRQARAAMHANPRAIILDVRNPQEYKAEHIPGAINLPDYAVKTHASRVLPDKSALILVHCKGGSRSQNAAKQLVSMGYTNVCDFGGIDSWPYEIV